MKILLASDLFPPMGGGVPISVEQLSHGLTGLGHEVVVIAPSYKSSSWLEKRGKIKIYRIGSFNLNRTRKLRFVYRFWEIDKLIDEISPDIVHIESVMTIGLFSALAARRRGIGVVATNHLMPENLVSAFHFPDFIEKVIGGLMMSWAFFVYRKANILLSPTNLARQMTVDNGWKGKVEVLSNGVDLQKFEGRLLPHAEARKKFHLGNALAVLYVGRLDKEKKVNVLLEAGSKIKKHDFQIILIGEGVEEKELKNLTEKLGIAQKVEFLGFVEHEHLMHLFDIADIFVMPSDIELQSISTLEAMANSLPVVACNAGALPELVKDGKNGFLFENNDAQGLALKLEKLLGDSVLREKFGKVNKKLAFEHSIPNVAREAEAYYKRLVKA